MLGFGNGGVVWAEQFMASGLVAVLVASTPFWMVGIESVAGGERLTGGLVGGLLLGFSGSCCWLAGPRAAFSSTRGWHWIGGLISTQLACVDGRWGRRCRSSGFATPIRWSSSAFQMLAGGLIMLTVVRRGRRIQSPQLD